MHISKDPQKIWPNCVNVRGNIDSIVVVNELILIKVASRCVIQLPGFLANVGGSFQSISICPTLSAVLHDASQQGAV